MRDDALGTGGHVVHPASLPPVSAEGTSPMLTLFGVAALTS